MNETWEYIKWTQDRQRVEQHYIAGGRTPSRIDVATESSYWAKDPAYSVFLKQLEFARPRGPHPRWPEISNAIQIAIQEALTGQLTAKAALAAAAKKVNAILK